MFIRFTMSTTVIGLPSVIVSSNTLSISRTPCHLLCDIDMSRIPLECPINS